MSDPIPISKIGVITTTIASLFGAYIMYMMVLYQMEVWELTFTHASGIVNVFWGVSLVLPFALQLSADSLIGNYWLLAITNLAYTAGLGLLALSTPLALASVTGTCKEYKPECVGNVQKILFYTSLPLIAIGISGHIAPTTALFLDQQDQTTQGSTPPAKLRSNIAVIAIPLVGFIAMVFVKPWGVRFLVPTIFTAIATLFFFSGSCSYKRVGPKGSPLTAFFKVLFASIIKMSRKADPSELYERDDIELNDPTQFIKHSEGLRCLDKAATQVPNQTVEQQGWKLCRVTEVEQTKLLVKVIPLSLTLIILGLVTSLGTTYFLAQADQMDPKLGHIKVPSLFLLVFFLLTKQCYENYCESSPRIGIGASMIFGALSCIAAAIVEHKRLNVAIAGGLIDSEKRASISMFWLIPQFVLLGLADGISNFSIRKGLLQKGYPKYMSHYMTLISQAALGVGTAGGVLSVFVVGKISEMGGKRSWFESSLDRSREDDYFWTLAGISGANFVAYVLVAVFYNPYTGDETAEEPDSEVRTFRFRPVSVLLTIPVALAGIAIAVAAMVAWIVGLVLTCICPCLICVPMIVAIAVELINLPLNAVLWVTTNIPF